MNLIPEKEHQARHLELHKALDELLADYLLHHPGSVPGKIMLIQLLEWSHQQTTEPTALDQSVRIWKRFPGLTLTAEGHVVDGKNRRMHVHRYLYLGEDLEKY